LSCRHLAPECLGWLALSPSSAPFAWITANLPLLFSSSLCKMHIQGLRANMYIYIYKNHKVCFARSVRSEFKAKLRVQGLFSCRVKLQGLLLRAASASEFKSSEPISGVQGRVQEFRRFSSHPKTTSTTPSRRVARGCFSSHLGLRQACQTTRHCATSTSPLMARLTLRRRLPFSCFCEEKVGARASCLK